MAALLYRTFAFLSLFSFGIHHLVSSTRSFLKPSSSSSSSRPLLICSGDHHIARPYYPLPFPHPFLRHLPLLLTLLSLLLSISHHTFLSSSSLSSLHTSASLLLFLLLLSSSFLLPFPLPSDLTFLLSSLSFALLSSSPSSFHPSDLQSKCDSLSSSISLASALLSLSLAIHPRLFLAELSLSASVSLQGLWSLQTLLSLSVDAFVPAGCHRLLEVADGSVRCELEASRERAFALLDLAFALHAAFASVVAAAVFAAAAAGGGVGRRCNGGVSYEAIDDDSEHVQMKAVAKNSMQA